MFIFFLIIMLPLLEIAGFIIIGGDIGVGWSLLWVIADTICGFFLLATIGTRTLQQSRKSVTAEVYPFEEMFDGVCVLVGALLLIFPGFVSDFLALPLLVPPVRHMILAFLKNRHAGIFNNLGKSTQGFTYWYYEEQKDGGSKTIEGSFRHTDEDTKLPK